MQSYRYHLQQGEAKLLPHEHILNDSTNNSALIRLARLYHLSFISVSVAP